MAVNAAAYLEGPRFKPRPADRLFSLFFSWLFSVLSGQCWQNTFRFYNDRFLSYPSQFIIYCGNRITRCCITGVSERTWLCTRLTVKLICTAIVAITTVFIDSILLGTKFYIFRLLGHFQGNALWKRTWWNACSWIVITNCVYLVWLSAIFTFCKQVYEHGCS